MPETAATETSAVEQSTTIPPENYIGPDGSFKENWQEHLVPAEIRNRNKMLWSGMKSVGDLVHQVNNQDIAISRQGKGIFPPGDKATDAEVRAFHRALGVPETPDGYDLNIPEEVQQYYQDDGLMAEARTTLHRLGLTPKQFAGVVALDAARMKKADEAMKADPMAFYEQALELAMPVMAKEAEKVLREKWGDAYDARLQLANAAITENMPEGEDRNVLLEHIGNDPLIADFLATIQNKHHTESHGIDTSLGTGAKYMSVEQHVQALMKDPNYMDGKTNPAEHHRLVDEVNRLLSQKTGGKMLE